MVAGPACAFDMSDVVNKVLILDQDHMDATWAYDFVLYRESKTGMGASVNFFTIFNTIQLRGGGIAYKNDEGYAGSNWILGPAITFGTIESWFNKAPAPVGTAVNTALDKYPSTTAIGISLMPEDWSNLKGDWGVQVFATYQLW